MNRTQNDDCDDDRDNINGETDEYVVDDGGCVRSCLKYITVRTSKREH